MAPKVALMVMVACVVLATPYTEALTPGAVVPPSCCSAVKSIDSATKKTHDRQAACKCPKGAAGGFNTSFDSALPGKCGVNVGYPINLSVDCSKYA